MLLVRRDFSERHMPGEWELPGGKAEVKEPIQDTIKRELYEETGLDLGNLKPDDLIMIHIPSYTQCVQIVQLDPEVIPDEPMGDVCGAWFPYQMVGALPLTWAARAVLCSGVIQRHYQETGPQPA